MKEGRSTVPVLVPTTTGEARILPTRVGIHRASPQPDFVRQSIFMKRSVTVLLAVLMRTM